MTLFPMSTVTPATTKFTKDTLPLCREVACDFRTGRPIFSAGNPVIVEGAAAVKVWVFRALRTVRGRYQIYSGDYGNEMEALVGQPYTEEVRQAEAIRYVREAIIPNPYVESVTEVSVSFEPSVICCSVKVKTIYGEVEVDA